MMPIKKGEMFWYDQAYALAERYDEQARLMDWEDELERIVSKMNEDARKILMILPPYKPQTKQEEKMGKLSRIWKRWCIGCEAGRPGTCVKVFSHRLAFLNHCCVPNVQQRLAPGLVTVQTQADDAKKGEDERSNEPGAKGKQSGQAKGTTSTKTVTKKTALCLFLRATKDIEVGEELTINYLTMLLPSETRKTMLHCVFGFHCKCNMCSSEYSGTTDIAWTSIATAMGAGNSLTRRKRPVDCIRLLSDSMWTLMTLGVTDVRYPRMLEGAADLYTEHADLARAFYLYLITTRLFEELLGADSDDVKRVKEKTYNLTHLRPRSKRGRSTLQESMLIFMNKDREQELLFQHSIKEDKDKKYRRLKLIRKRNDWLRYFDWDKYRHERTIMELDMLLAWTEKWMEDRLKFLWEKGSLDAYEEEEAKTKGKKKTKKAKKKKKRKR
ncbi:hypothetical protein KEM55_003251 [Ascosphaera atra]|nr:hypothetical protein KEM55_003251 [Ascosphaera atra]